jgi:Lipocalin-like domain
MQASARPQITSNDPLGGDEDQRAAAYSTCLAYFGSYEVLGDVIVHRIDASLFPNWTGTVHERLFTCRGNELVLRTPPSENSGVTVVNETSWKRDVPGQDS